MTSRLRFTKATDVFDAYPMLACFAKRPETEIDPLDYVRRELADKHPLAALAMMAHTLPRREAVWWGRRCVSAALGGPGEDECAAAAERWVRAPDDPNRRAALNIGTSGDSKRATTWLALAAGRSGGSVAPPEQTPLLLPPESCAQAVGAAVTLAIVSKPADAIPAWFAACLNAGIDFANGGEMRVVAPKA